MSFWGFGPTELRIILAIGNLVVLRTPMVTILGESWKLFDIGAAVAIPALIIAFTMSAVKNGKALFRAEPVTRREADAAMPVSYNAAADRAMHMPTFENVKDSHERHGLRP